MRDIISDLPDPVLLHILSSDSLDTKQVIATSLLSRRWRSLWLSIPKLHFLIDHRVHSLESFVQFVDAALLLVDLNSVKKFYLECDGNFCIPSIKVNIWITALMRNKLEHLTLYLCYYGDFFKLPASVFMWSTIRVIKLSGVILSNLSSVNLPSLRALHLAHVKVTESQSLTILLSNLVYLEELRINFLDMDSNDPNLKLDIRRYDYLVCANAILFSPPSLLPIEMFSNVTFLQFGEGDWFLRNDIPTFNNLIHLTMCYLNYEVWSDFVTSLRNFLKLETLITHGSCWGRDGDGNDSEDDVVLMGTIPEVPPCVLSHLKVFVFHTLDRNCEMVQFILEHAKVLREIVIRIPYFKSDVYKFLREFIPPICPDNCRLSIDVGMADEFSVSKKFRY